MSAVSSRAGPADVRRLARGGVLNLLGAIANALSNFALVFVVTRTLSQATAGQFFAATSVFLLLLGVGQLGARSGLVYFVARMRALGLPQLVGSVLRLALIPVLLVCTLISVLLWAFADALADLAVGGPTGHTPDFLRTLAFLLPFAAILDGVLGATRGYGDMRATVVIEKTARPLAQVAAVIVVGLFGTTWAMVLGWAAPYAPALVAAVVWLVVLRRSTARSAAESTPPSLAAVGPTHLRRDYWRFAAPRAISNVMQVALQRLDVVIVAALLGPAPAVMYVAATRLVALGAFGAQAISMAVEPQAAAHYVGGEYAAVNDLYRTSTAWLMLLTWPMYLLAVAFAPTLLSVFGSGYRQAATVLVVLSAASLLSTGCGLVDVMLLMAGRASWLLVNVSLALAVNVGLNLILVPSVGITGAAWAWGAAIAVNNLLPLAQLRMSAGIHPLGRATAAAAAVSCGAFAPVALVALSVWGQSVVSLGVATVAGSVIYLVLIWKARRVLRTGELVAALPGIGRRRLGREPASLG